MRQEVIVPFHPLTSVGSEFLRQRRELSRHIDMDFRRFLF